MFEKGRLGGQGGVRGLHGECSGGMGRRTGNAPGSRRFGRGSGTWPSRLCLHSRACVIHTRHSRGAHTAGTPLPAGRNGMLLSPVNASYLAHPGPPKQYTPARPRAAPFLLPMCIR